MSGEIVVQKARVILSVESNQERKKDERKGEKTKAITPPHTHTHAHTYIQPHTHTHTHAHTHTPTHPPPSTTTTTTTTTTTSSSSSSSSSSTHCVVRLIAVGLGTVLSSSVQFKIVSRRSEKTLGVQHHISEELMYCKQAVFETVGLST